MHLIFFRFITLFTLCFCSSLAWSQNLRFEQQQDGLLFLENDMPRYFYRTAIKNNSNKYARTNYIHPLYDNNGVVITEDFPEDHPHHHGIFWSWHQLIIDGKQVADPWLNENISWEVLSYVTSVSGNRATLFAEIDWKLKSSRETVLHEKLIVKFVRNSKDAYTMDFTVELTALKDGIALGGSDDNKGYGGFSARLKLPEEVSFNSKDSTVIPQNLPIKVGPWMNISDSDSGVVLMGEPEKLPQYQGWILRKEKSMQNLAFPGAEPLSMKKGSVLYFKNRLLIHNGLTSDEIQNSFDAFKKENVDQK